MVDDLHNAYEARLSLLTHVANALEQETRDYLSELVNTNQVRFRLLETDDFVTKAKQSRSADPLVEIEDQIVGSVMVRPDAPPAVEQRLQDVFSAVQGNWQDSSDNGGATFPTRCLLCLIPPQVKPPGWDARNDVPKTFELRVCVDPTLPARPPDTGDVITTATEGRVLFGLHGIRTHADWYSDLTDLGPKHGWLVRTGRWRFGYFPIWLFVLPFAREMKVRWFRKVYREEIQDRDVDLVDGQHPSIVAHSFGTYILGNALLKYDWLRFNKVILCGSILPQDYPWDRLIERGQVQTVRNEYGMKDPWTRLVRWFVAGTGPSGRYGFTCSHERFEQEEFAYDHSEYFEKGHMEAKWFPFLEWQLPLAPFTTISIGRSQSSRPWVLYAAYAVLIFVFVLIAKRCGLYDGIAGLFARVPAHTQTTYFEQRDSFTRRTTPNAIYNEWNDSAKKELKKHLERGGLSRVADRLVELMDVSILIQATPASDGELRVGDSRLGGTPDLPDNISWPEYNGVAMALVAQFRLDDIAAYNVDERIPPRGMLYFFCETEAIMTGTDGIGTWKVIYYCDNPSSLKPASIPATLPKKSRLRMCRVAFANTITLPPAETKEIELLKLTPVEEKRYAAFPVYGFEAVPFHHLLGYPATIQNDMRQHCSTTWNGLDQQKENPKVHGTTQDLEKSEWRLLLQIDSDKDGLGALWGDAGRMYFWIREQDLQKRDFSHVCLMFQCH